MNTNSKESSLPGMFSFGRRKKSSTLTSVVTRDTGVTISQIEHTKKGNAVLHACDFIESPVDIDTDLGTMLKGRGLGKQHCSTLLPVGEYQLLLVDAPEVPPAELRSAIRWRIQNMINYHIDDAVLDVFDAQSNNPNTTHEQLHVVVAKSSTIKKHINQLEQAGVNLDIIDIPELALRNIAARLPEDKNGVVTLYFEQHHCLMTLTHNSDLFVSRKLDIGYQKLEESAANPQALINRLALEIQRSMDYYEHSYHQPHIRAMAILPIPAALYGFSDALQQTLGIDTRVLTMSDIVECNAEPDEHATAHCILAVGCALRNEEKAL